MKDMTRLGTLTRRTVAGIGLKKDPVHIESKLGVMPVCNSDFEVTYYICNGHVDNEDFIKEVVASYGGTVTRIEHKYTKEVRITPKNASALRFNTNSFCLETEYGARPVTIGYAK